MEKDIEGEKGGARVKEKRRPATKVNEVETEGEKNRRKIEENWRKIGENWRILGENWRKIGENWRKIGENWRITVKKFGNRTEIPNLPIDLSTYLPIHLSTYLGGKKMEK